MCMVFKIFYSWLCVTAQKVKIGSSFSIKLDILYGYILCGYFILLHGSPTILYRYIQFIFY